MIFGLNVRLVPIGTEISSHKVLNLDMISATTSSLNKTKAAHALGQCTEMTSKFQKFVALKRDKRLAMPQQFTVAGGASAQLRVSSPGMSSVMGDELSALLGFV